MLEDATGDAECGIPNSLKKAGPGGNTVTMAGYMSTNILLLALVYISLGRK
jgi:hypothetical protein